MFSRKKLSLVALLSVAVIPMASASFTGLVSQIVSPVFNQVCVGFTMGFAAKAVRESTRLQRIVDNIDKGIGFSQSEISLGRGFAHKTRNMATLCLAISGSLIPLAKLIYYSSWGRDGNDDAPAQETQALNKLCLSIPSIIGALIGLATAAEMSDLRTSVRLHRS